MDSGKRFRAPRDDGAVVAVPPLHTVGDLLAINRQRLQTAGERVLILDRPLAELRRQARLQLAQASGVASAPRESSRGADATPLALTTLLVAGHQPELFHPGVWVKNFALYGLARRHHAASLNLVVDDDTIKTTALQVPAPPHVRRILFDRWTGAAPYEERTIADRALFASFAERVGEITRNWPYEPLLPAFWTEVLRQAERTANLGECFAAARRTFEQAWGCHNQEVPLSSLCDSEPFAYFACHILANLPQFHSLYNEIVADYRRRHGIRDRQHPVPDLAADGDWLEAPFWIWRSGTSQRERLFARLDNDKIEISINREPKASGVALAPRGSTRADPRGANATPLATWQHLQSRGYKLRTRALTTTLYARLFLADLFLHGIGGGIYDELTDELMRRFYGCEPPEYVVVSATRWLPLPRPAAAPHDRRRLTREIRDLHFNPQRHLHLARGADATGEPRGADATGEPRGADATGEPRGADATGEPRGADATPLAELVQRKNEWIARQPATPAERRERFHTLRDLTEQLRPPLLPRTEELQHQLHDCEHESQTHAILSRRDYSFCLFPESVLRPFCTQFLEK